ncbi:type VI secretion system baseplate subunit TssF [Acetobacteraceae bacterium KSS8]|uniref:Type VI secretion system baseplate subunit TssF n=1 Tax=Endosaccharibacter trunci TaxID=2812733 RepID=A0ABT1W8D3_9PROT|nr:type VI secretion system baseplate subunit TssF [Acetobacteraceae bacterium KSS8]
MPIDLSDAYQRELDAIRRLAGEFAEAHPKIARRLRVGPNGVDDPHVERLLEGAAFLSARTQQRLDDEFPELTDALLGVLYPRYLAPIPSAAIVRFTARPDLRAPVPVPAGTMLEADPYDGIACRFRTASPVTLWPIEIVSTQLSGLPLNAPVVPVSRQAKSSLRIRLRMAGDQARFNELAPDTLRFFIDAPVAQAIRLLELMSQHTLGLALANGPNDDRPTALPATSLSAAGFAPDEALYPWPRRTFSGFRLLTEYFALPEKFLFVDIAGLDARTLVQDSNELELFAYFDVAMPELERVLQPNCLALGCTPVVNLYPGACEPIRLDHWRTDYVVEPARDRAGAEEVWDVEQVREIDETGAVRPWRPLYQQLAEDDGNSAGMFALIRRPDANWRGGTETRLSLIDLQLDPDRPADRVLSVDALLTNRDLPSRLPVGGGEPRLHPTEGLGSVSAITCLTPPTPSWRAPLREKHNWRLISHLVLGRLGLTGGGDAAASLREWLRLYDVRDADDTRHAVASLLAVDTRDSVARVPGARIGSFCRGLEVTLLFDAAHWDAGGLYLLASILERVLALHVTVNSFVRTVVRLRGRSDPVARFAPRAGDRVLL